MHETEAPPAEERRRAPRHDHEPARWEEVARRREWDTLPFLHYFDELNNPAPRD